MSSLNPPPRISSKSSFYDSTTNTVLINNYFKRLYKSNKQYHRFNAIIFKPQLSLLDAETNRETLFSGFYTLFWMVVALVILQSFCHTYAATHTLFGFNILNLLQQDLFKVGLVDLAMYLSTFAGVVLQKAVRNGYLSWSKTGWVLQNVYQCWFLFFFIHVGNYLEFHWIARVFLLLHSIVLLMKMHSFAFSNGYLWSVKEQVEKIDLVLAAGSGEKNDGKEGGEAGSQMGETEKEQLKKFRDFLAVELVMQPESKVEFHQMRSASSRENSPTGTSSRKHHHLHHKVRDDDDDNNDSVVISYPTSPATEFPDNISFKSYLVFSTFPTVVYRHEYPRTDRIRWSYVAEKTVETFGIFFLMIILAENHLYPVAVDGMKLRSQSRSGSLAQDYLVVLARLIPPFVLMFLLVFFIIWDAILNAIAELTCFADRGFYGPWWNCVTWDQFARDWNTPVHQFLLQHVYHSTISALNFSKYSATLTTFFLSSCVHELVMYVIFKRLRGYFLLFQMFQLPLVAVSNTKYLRDKRLLGNVIFWTGIMVGPSLVCSLYLVF